MGEFTLHPKLQADTFFVDDLPLCKLLLINDSQYPWVVLVPRVPDIKEAYQLNPIERWHLVKESDAVCKAMNNLFTPDKLNVAAIGNVVPQLHVHHIARYRNDASWPAPVWGAKSPIPYDEQNLQLIINKLKTINTAL